MRFRKRRRKKVLPGRQPGLITFIIIIVVLFLIVESVLLLERKIRPAILSVAELKADIMATDSINIAISEEISPAYLYSDLISVDKDNQGRIVMAQVNTMVINKLVAETTLITQEALRAIEKRPFSIPMGEIFDNYLLATYGPRIPVKLIPMGRVNTQIHDRFEEAGINQVRHSLYLEVNTEVRVIVPFIRTPVEVYTTIPVSDAIYQGDVPDTVINLQF